MEYSSPHAIEEKSSRRRGLRTLSPLALQQSADLDPFLSLLLTTWREVPRLRLACGILTLRQSMDWERGGFWTFLVRQMSHAGARSLVFQGISVGVRECNRNDEFSGHLVSDLLPFSTCEK